MIKVDFKSEYIKVTRNYSADTEIDVYGSRNILKSELCLLLFYLAKFGIKRKEVAVLVDTAFHFNEKNLDHDQVVKVLLNCMYGSRSREEADNG